MRDDRSAHQRLRARVCVVMHVHNAQKTISQAIESVLGQTFTDLELIIADNASTDATPQICQELAGHDPRVIYTHYSRPIDAANLIARNFGLSAGQYLKWAPATQQIEPTFIQRSVVALDRDPTSILAYPATSDSTIDVRAVNSSNSPEVRFQAIACITKPSDIHRKFFGLIRRRAMDLIPMPGGFIGSERVFLARLVLYGKFLPIPEAKDISRSAKSEISVDAFFHAAGSAPSASFSEWQLAWEFLKSTQYGWLTARQRVACIAAIIQRQSSRSNAAQMLREIASLATPAVATLSRASDPEPAFAPQVPVIRMPLKAA